MNRKAAFLLMLILILLRIASVSAQCNSTQVDINSASADELDRLYGIGPSKAQGIIGSRPFRSVDDLINVSGIGTVTLEKIKEQDLACVKEENESQNSTGSENVSVSIPEETSTAKNSEDTQSDAPGSNKNSFIAPVAKSKMPVTSEVINLDLENTLNASKDNAAGNSSSSGSIAIYGLIAFSLLLGSLFAARKFRTKRYKSEFD